MREEPDGWFLEQVLVTLMQRDTTPFMDLCSRVNNTLMLAYEESQRADPRWVRSWEDIQLLVNPNGPLVNGGSDGDNGQTGRKLVMDYYGPRIPLGGGALCGKDLSHIDRAAAYAAREAAVKAVQSGARECRVTLAYAPNLDLPLEVDYLMEGRGVKQDLDFFRHDHMYDRYRDVRIAPAIPQGDHFFNPAYPWNGLR